MTNKNLRMNRNLKIRKRKPVGIPPKLFKFSMKVGYDHEVYGDLTLGMDGMLTSANGKLRIGPFRLFERACEFAESQLEVGLDVF